MIPELMEMCSRAEAHAQVLPAQKQAEGCMDSEFLMNLLLNPYGVQVNGGSGVDSDTLTPWKDTPEAVEQLSKSLCLADAPNDVSTTSPTRKVSGSEISPRQISQCNSDLPPSVDLISDLPSVGRCEFMERGISANPDDYQEFQCEHSGELLFSKKWGAYQYRCKWHRQEWL